MHVLVVGSGGREHTLAWALSRSPSVTRVSSTPGNPGMEQLGPCLDIAGDDAAGLRALVAREGVDLVVIGPEAPLVAGVADGLREAGVPVFGPGADGARLEGSKVFSKELFRDAGVPTAPFEVFDSADAAEAYVRRQGAPIVVKADGLAAGKGALVCGSVDEAVDGIDRIMRRREFGAAGDRVVVEECLSGPEVSVMVLTDGETVWPLPVSQDHKRAWVGDEGPNTGGMGAYSPVPLFDDALIGDIVESQIKPTVKALRDRGIVYRGVLYGGFMITEQGPQTLEYNCRFGDPETQVLLPRLEGDFAAACLATAQGRLAEADLRNGPRAAVCVVMASGGYPGDYKTGLPINGLEAAAALEDVLVFHAGTRREGDRIVTAGGRVLGVTALGDDLDAAIPRAYEAVERIEWANRYYRTDIAWQVRGRG